MKTVILHYHLFKNAGTSLDAAFKENFSEDRGEWLTKEFPAQPAANRQQVKQWIIDNPSAICFSSHTALFPVPEIDGIKIIPVIFFRHPIDRIASAYLFEKKQGGDGFGSTLARNTTLGGYIETRLAVPVDRQCRNFHSQRFSTMYGENQGEEAARAEMAIESLPFVGLVQDYSKSLEKLVFILKEEGFDGIALRPTEKNVTRDLNKNLNEKLADIERQIGKELYTKLVEANMVDLAIWSKLVKVFL